MDDAPDPLLTTVRGALGLDAGSGTGDDVVVRGTGVLPSHFGVTDLAGATVAAAGLAAAEVVADLDPGTGTPRVEVDRDAACVWFGTSLRPRGWSLPPVWDAVAGLYPGADGWIRLHTNAPAHRKAALAVLGAAPERAAVGSAVARWAVGDLEDAVVAAGGSAGAVRSLSAWRTHAQGEAVAAAPLVELVATPDAGCAVPAPGRPAAPTPTPARPLAGVRVLDLTRVLAGPVVTRALAGLGADVLRLDPPGWDEAVAPEVTLGKRCARLDLRTTAGRDRFVALLAGADVLVHGLRPGALERLGLSAAERDAVRPGLVDVSLSAYGWDGPWAGRRGFDSVVQCSAGIADEGARRTGADVPLPLPVQALDHGAGWLLAACALRGVARARRGEGGLRVRLTLAGLAHLLTTAPDEDEGPPLDPAAVPDAPGVEHTSWGEATRAVAPVALAGTGWWWSRGAVALGADAPAWA